MFILHKVKSRLNTKSLNFIYYSLIYPNIMYFASVWGFKITVPHKKIFRIVEEVSYRDHSEPIYVRLKILKFVNVPIYICLLILFKTRKFHCDNVWLTTLLGLRRKILYLVRSQDQSILDKALIIFFCAVERSPR